MGLEVKLAFAGNLAAFTRETHLRFARGARIAAERFAVRAKLAYRGAVRTAGLGDRLANTVRVDIYPKSASVHTHAPTVYVWTKAPKILHAFATGVTITGRDGLWLAIATENTPHRSGRRVASPREVEVIFNQKLIFIHGRGGQLLAFVNVVKGKSGRLRRGTSAKTGRTSRKAELVLMFVMVRQVSLRKRLDWDRVTADLAISWGEVFGEEIARALAA